MQCPLQLLAEQPSPAWTALSVLVYSWPSGDGQDPRSARELLGLYLVFSSDGRIPQL